MANNRTDTPVETVRPNGRKMGESESEAHEKLLKENTVDDDDDDLVISVQVPQISLGHGNMDASSTQMSLNANRGTNIKRHSSSSLRGTWKLKYQDFLPSKKITSNSWTSTEHFSKLVDTANEWLKSNTDVQVKTCQTMTWIAPDHKKLGNSEQMVMSKVIAENATTYCLRGLRLWLVPQYSQKTYQLVCTDILPEPNDNIPTLVNRLNKKIEQKQLKGKIVTLETVSVPVISGKVDSRVTRWIETSDDDFPQAYILRLFQVRESKSQFDPQNACLEIKDVVPVETEEGYEGFEDLVDRMNTWLRDQTDVLVINMQSLMAQSNVGSHADTGSACFFNYPGVNSPHPVDFFRILRVVYMRVQGEKASALPMVYPFTYETFTPELVRHKESSCRERMEKMNETFSKCIAFLRNSGADLICAEMVYNPMQLYTADELNNAQNLDEIKFLYTVRLYLTGQIGRLDGSLRSIKRASIASSRARNSPSASVAHPGPIFLRSVVTRQFKYRWLVLAISVLTCMTVIVVVSVVYSNR